VEATDVLLFAAQPNRCQALIAGVIVASALGWGSVLQFASVGALLLYGAAILVGDN
jgi:hypothetical protein